MRRLLVTSACVLLAGCPSPSGKEGPEGPQGPKGDTGAQGPIGPTGTQGPIGPLGMSGMTGAAGPQGPMGAVLVLDGGVVTGPQGLQGASVVLRSVDAGVQCAKGGVLVSLEDGGSPQVICNGLDGPQGLQGIQGLQGMMGATGLPGVQGPIGMQGPVGAMGAPGVQGMTGPAGAAGATGAAGTAGPQGTPGALGPMGPPGPAGPALLLDGGTFPVSASEGYSFAGFTTSLYDGNLGGPIGANAKCSAQFVGSHFCTDREYEWSGVSTSPGAAGFWADDAQYSSQSSPNYYPRDRSGSYSCNNWRSADGPANYAQYTDAQGLRSNAGYGICNVQRQIACCRSAHSAWFRGFTAALYDGNLGGPIGANAKCSLEYPRSHFCTDREYAWAGSGVTPGPAGFWADDAQYSSQSSPNYYPRDRSGSYSCNNWRSADGPANYAQYSDAQGLRSNAGYGICNVPRQLACCGG